MTALALVPWSSSTPGTVAPRNAGAKKRDRHDMGPHLEAAKALQRLTGGPVLVVHHTRMMRPGAWCGHLVAVPLR